MKMRLNFLKLLFPMSLLLTVACSEQTAAPPPAKAYVTNAEYVLEAIKTNNTSAVAFQVKPIRSSACEHMYIEFGQKNSEGEWSVTNAVFPGKNRKENFGQEKLSDQIHFAEVDGVGDFGIIAFGCKPYGREMKTYRGLMATFEVKQGRLNYIGEAALLPGGEDFAAVYVVDRSVFAQEQIKNKLPELEDSFHKNIMERYVPKLTKEQQAALDGFEARKKAMQPLLDMRNQVVTELNVVIKEWNNFIDIHGERSSTDDAPEVKRESKRIFRKKRVLESQLELHDKFIDQRRSVKYVKRYMSLYSDYEAKKEAYYVAKRDKSISDNERNERNDRETELNAARDVFLEFKDKNK